MPAFEAISSLMTKTTESKVDHIVYLQFDFERKDTKKKLIPADWQGLIMSF